MRKTPIELGRERPDVIRQERSINRQSIKELLMAAIQKYEDASQTSVSGPTRLEAAYDAILFCALAVFAAEGYRVSAAQGHHRLALEGLAGALKLKETVIDEVESLLDVRNSKYTGFLTANPADIKMALSLGERVLSETEYWFAAKHPEILKS